MDGLVQLPPCPEPLGDGPTQLAEVPLDAEESLPVFVVEGHGGSLTEIGASGDRQEATPSS